MAVDISGLSYFMPIFGFLFVFTIVYAILHKTEILGDNKFINLLVGFIVAIIFATMTNVREYVETVTPWFVVLIVSLFFVLLIIGFSQKKIDDIMKPGFTWVFIAVLIIVFLLAAINVFSSFSSVWGEVTEFIDNESRIAGGILLLIIAAFAAWVLTKK